MCTSSRSDVLSGHHHGGGGDRWRLCDILFSTERYLDSAGGGGCGGSSPTATTTNIYINTAGSASNVDGGGSGSHWKKANYCQIVTADGCRITIPKEEDLYNPV